MKKKIFSRNHRKIQGLILAIAIFFMIGIGEGKEMTLQESIQWGIEKNYDLQTIRNTLEDLQTNLQIINAGESFQIDLNITPIWRFGTDDQESVFEGKTDRFAPSVEANLTVTKKISPDLNFSTQIKWEAEPFSKNILNSLTEDVNASVRLDRMIYPKTWTEHEKQVYALENDIKMKWEELRWAEMEKQIEFIQNYLNILRIQELVGINRDRLQFANEELERVKQLIALGEGGYQQEKDAEIAVEEIKSQLLQREQSLLQAQKKWHLLLSLPDGVMIRYKEDYDFLNSLFYGMEMMPVDRFRTDEMIRQSLESHFRIKNIKMEKEELIQELEWTRDEGKVSVNLSGGYEYPDQNWFVMLDFSANLADGGSQNLKEQQKEDSIQSKEVSVDHLIKTMKLEIEQLLDQDQYNQLFLDTQELVLEKEKKRVEIMEKQFELGAISLIQLQNSRLTLKEKENDLLQARDQWFIDRLKLAHYIGHLQEGVSLKEYEEL